MDNCQNCGCEGHCPEPLYKEIDGNNNTMWLGGGPSRAELEESMK